MAKRISQLLQILRAEIAQNDLVPIVDVSAGKTKYATIADAFGIPDITWTPTGETHVYSAWDSTIRQGIITVPTNATTKYQPGMRYRITQSTGGTKVGIIMAVSATTLTVFFPVGTTLNNEAITSPMYSALKTPFGFDDDPALWSLDVTDANDNVQVGAVANTWYNLGSTQAVLGIGAWRLSYKVATYIGNTNGGIGFKVTLSTANNSESNTKLSTYWETTGGVSQQASQGCSLPPEDVKLAAKTTYYLNTRFTSGSNSAIYNFGARSLTVIKAVCAYL